MVPTATERSPWPPGFSFCIMAAQARWGSRRPFVVEQGGRGGFEEAGGEAFADQAALAVAAVAVEAVADDRAGRRGPGR